MISGVQEENRSGQKGLFEGLGSIQSESSVQGMHEITFNDIIN